VPLWEEDLVACTLLLCYRVKLFFLVAQNPSGRPHMTFVDQTEDTVHSVGILWKSDRSVAATSTWQHKTHRKQVAVDSRLRPRGYWDRQRLVELTTFNVVSVATIIKSSQEMIGRKVVPGNVEAITIQMYVVHITDLSRPVLHLLH